MLGARDLETSKDRDPAFRGFSSLVREREINTGISLVSGCRRPLTPWGRREEENRKGLTQEDMCEAFIGE